MKILAIRGKNLASIEGIFEIDFEREPLKSAGIFAITGPTGAGKSTLLDALSLALYNKTPRISNTEDSVYINDVREKTINQKDSRNILRRGCSEGFAEVDFLALDGKPYRSLWSVKRARQKIDGSLQDADIRVTDLSDGNPLQGTKTELLAQLVALTGLTFEQFSRAVLLAQGDFAAFLKAKSNEKAELLEKLTGTEIYSKISIAIYEKTGKALAELTAINEKIKGVELLTKEEIEALNTEMEEINLQVNQHKKKLENLDKKLIWIKKEQELRQSEQEAISQCQEAIQQLEEAKPKAELLSQIDSIQEIRDQYLRWKEIEKQLLLQRAEFTKREDEKQEVEKTVQESIQKWTDFNKKQDELNRKFILLEPEIIRARELDVNIKHSIEEEDKARKEWKEVSLSREKIEKNQIVSEENLLNLQKKQDGLNQWFMQYQSFAKIADSTELIVNLADNLQQIDSQLALNKKTFSKNEERIKIVQEKLEELKIETERLNTLLPAEIAVLREKLVEGEPCPVCGSRHHPLDDLSPDGKLNEEEINKAKAKNEKEWEKRNNEILDARNDNHKLSGLIDNNQLQIDQVKKTLAEKLADFNGWEKLLEEGVLQERLVKRATEWQSKTVEKEKISSTIIILSNSLNNEKFRLEEIRKDELLKKDKLTLATEKLKDQREKRGELLEGKSADEVSTQFADNKKQLQKELEQAAAAKESAMSKRDSLKGNIERIKVEIENTEDEEQTLRNEVEQWIGYSQSITMVQLTELAKYDAKKIAQMKAEIQEINHQKTVAETTLAERKRNCDEHHKSLEKPNAEENNDSLTQQRNNEQFQIEKSGKRKAEITVLLTNHKQGEQKIILYDKQLKEKRRIWENLERINSLFGSASGNKFKTIAQGYTLDALLNYANIHLKELSHRYELQRIPDSLALQIIDLDMLNEVRSVHSLSGGESFLVSLALALGLSSLSSNRMKVESLFIDEGFGSLDIDTLRIAMDALERLQNQGRKIGVISHVAEMTERITTQIRVVKESGGKSKVDIVGN
ncbi:Flp pilus assembly complex ATPase component TadA [Bacteroidales bacterium OttesenSCG-928-B11]|nr:Flp pilus assembly complex ATPase component TadA [Bacteroidales bacterium OttesenSCG-928-B11]